MSIKIDTKTCIGCSRCVEVCPGNLIKKNGEKVVIRRPRDCWGCTSCVKACPVNAISFFLGADIGGRGSWITVNDSADELVWIIHRFDGTIQEMRVNKKESNTY